MNWLWKHGRVHHGRRRTPHDPFDVDRARDIRSFPSPLSPPRPDDPHALRHLPRQPVKPQRLPLLRGLDGLRAFSVAAVLVYHAQAMWLPGGFLGVEFFFVISGFLITAQLLIEWRGSGRI